MVWGWRRQDGATFGCYGGAVRRQIARACDQAQMCVYIDMYIYVYIIYNTSLYIQTSFTQSSSWSKSDRAACVVCPDREETVVELLNRGANALQRDRHGWNPLMTASFHGRVKVGKLLSQMTYGYGVRIIYAMGEYSMTSERGVLSCDPGGEAAGVVASEGGEAEPRARAAQLGR